MKGIGGTDVDHGNAGQPDLYRTGCRDGRGVADAAGVALTTGGSGEGLRQSATQTRRRLI